MIQILNRCGFGRLFVKWFALCCWTIVLSVCLSFLSVCHIGVLWPNGWMDQDDTWHGGRHWPRPHCVRWDGNPTPAPKRYTVPQFWPMSRVQTAGWIKIPLGTEVSLSPGHIVLDGDPAPLPKKGGQQPPSFQPMYCGQTTGWIKMPLDTDVGLGPGHIVLDGDAGPSPQKGAKPPNLRPMSLVAKRLDGSNATWYAGRPRLWPQCVRWVPSSPPPKGAQPLQFLGHDYCCQTAGWIKMALGMELYGGIPRPWPHCVRLGPSPPPQKGTQQPPSLWPMSIMANCRPSQLLLSLFKMTTIHIR